MQTLSQLSISPELTVSIVSAFATVTSTWIAIWQHMKVRKLNKEKRKLNWDDLQVAIDKLFKQIEKSYKPEVVICLSERGAAIVTMGFSLFGRNLPIYTGFWQDANKGIVDLTNTDFIEFNSRGRKFYIPQAIFSLKDKRLLLIDDWAFTGEAMNHLYSKLKESGVEDDNIRCAALVATPSAKQIAKPKPELFFNYYEMPDNEFYFPWGKAS